MLKKKNKRGETFLSGHVMNIILAAIIILVLLYLAYKVVMIYYYADVRRAADILTAIDDKVNYLTGGSFTGTEVKFMVYSPKGDPWFLVSFEKNSFPEKECNDNKDYRKCLCVCDNEDCDGSKACKGFKNSIGIKNLPNDLDKYSIFLGISSDGKTCSCAKDSTGPGWECSANCGCFQVSSSGDTSKTIAEKMIGCLDEVKAGTYQDSNLVRINVIPLVPAGTELKIQKKMQDNVEIIEISKS